MKNKKIFTLMMAIMLVFTLTQSAAAFKDVKDHSQASKINQLQLQGILNGDGRDQFHPDRELTYAEGISMLVKAFDLNIDNIRFIKAPKVTDSFPNLDPNAWYADAFIIAFYNDLDIPQDVKANDKMTREQFAHHLFKSVIKKGDYAFIEIYMMFKDAENVSKPYQESVQKVLISNWMTLEGQFFHPAKAITRGDAAGAVYEAVTFVNNSNSPATPFPLDQIELEQIAVNKDVNKIIVHASAPHPGYGIAIKSITFENDVATIEIAAILPDPDKMYPQVITKVSAETFISSKYKVEYVYADSNQGAGSSDSSHSSNSDSTSPSSGGSSSSQGFDTPASEPVEAGSTGIAIPAAS